MRALKRKAASQKGASITFSLLLFLVCAVISSVVIVAATAAAGRMSKMAETDQRYYAVTSATELLCDLCGEIGDDGILVIYDTEDGAVVHDEDATLFIDASERLVEVSYLDPEETVSLDDSPYRTRSLKLAPSEGQSIQNAEMDCTIEMALQKNGLLTFKISSDDGNSNKAGQYALYVTFSSNMKKVVSNTLEKTETTKVTWSLYSIEKARTEAQLAEAEESEGEQEEEEAQP